MRYLVPIIIVTATLLALDLYVYHNWKRFAREGRVRWTLHVYRLLVPVMPLTLPAYLYLYSWWEVEPRLARALFFSLWALYYLPKVPIVVVLLLKDAARLVRAIGARRTAASRSDAERTAASRSDAERIPASRSGTERIVASRSGTERIDRAEFLRRVGWSAAAIPFIATGYGVYRTLYDFSVHRVEIPVAGLPTAFDGMTIAQLSDLHAGSLFSARPMWDAVALTNELQPDLVALTGDFVNNDVEEMARVLPALNALRATVGVFGCLGNHDHYADTDRLVEQIDTTPIDLLVNEHRTIQMDGSRLHVIGTDNTGFRQHHADLPRAVAGIENGDGAQILLAHDPTFWDIGVRPDYRHIDLMLCGHTHGGQFGVEFGPLRWSLAALRYERWAGLYVEPRSDGQGDQFLYVNRGIGTVGPPLRMGIRPEITLLTLRRV